MASKGGSTQSQPILFGRDAQGNLCHIDSVANGEACGCFCPDPSCGQVLIARNGGTKRIHHFAHKRGTCEWSIEYLISTLAADILRGMRCATFPALSYRDWMSSENVEIAPAKQLRFDEVSLEHLSGRGAPDVVVGCKLKSGSVRRFALVFSLIHTLTPGQLEKLRAAGADAVLIDLKVPLRWKKRELDDKHFDRVGILTSFQEPAFIRKVLLNDKCPYKVWAANARREAAEAESLAEYERTQEEERRRKAEAARQRELERQQKEEKRRRVLKELREEQERAQAAERERLRREEEERERQRLEAERRDRASLAEALEQQECQARDSQGRRWVKCRICGEAKLADRFQSYGGAGSVNLGVCSECYHADLGG